MPGGKPLSVTFGDSSPKGGAKDGGRASSREQVPAPNPAYKKLERIALIRSSNCFMTTGATASFSYFRLLAPESREHGDDLLFLVESSLVLSV